jgi:hypothetical protein
MHIRISGTLDAAHNKQHLPHVFTMPTNAEVLAIRFDYEPKVGANVDPQVSLTLFDPHGARGARHCNPDQTLRITAKRSTPGYVAGALQPGTWTAWIDVHRLLSPDVIHYTFDIEISFDAPDEVQRTWVRGTTAARGEGWYRGDLHGHTLHSDGAWDVPDFVQYARDYHLDFVTLTDHNTVSPLAQHDSLAADDLLTMGGIELTTYYGHALALGVRTWQEWRAGLDGITMPQLAERAMAAGAVFIIAHPHSIGDPWCTGCDWAYPEMMPGNARCVEIWNGDWLGSSGNEQGLQLWYRWLNDGYRMVATAGTDIHGPMRDRSPGFNVVYAHKLSESAILDAIRQGHLFISAGPTLELTAINAVGDAAMMGDMITGSTVELALAWKGAGTGDQLRLIVNGAVRDTITLDGDGDKCWTLDTADGRWATAELRRVDGHMLAVTNPIFLNRPDGWR